MAQPLKPFGSAPRDWDSTWADWVTAQLNQLAGQGPVTPSNSGFPTLVNPVIDPSTTQIKSVGSRPQSLTTPIQIVASANNIAFFWDGSNSSLPFQVYRDDGSISPAVKGNLNVTGLTPNTKYFFYQYFDEATNLIKFVAAANVSGAVGTPAVAYTAQNIKAGQQQLLRGHIPLSIGLATTGISTTAAGTNPPVSSGNGGGGGGGAGGRYFL